MGPRYTVPAGEAQSQLVRKQSVFVGLVGHASTADAAHAFVARARTAYADAHHHACAYRITDGPQALVGSSDDGEPGGTAGRPMLAVLEGSGLCEVIAVGVRFFGGIKLGTGGLVRAYASAVQQALASLSTTERVLHRLAHISVDYALYGRLQYLLPRMHVRVDETRFAEMVTLGLAVPYDREEEVVGLLRELTNGRVALDAQWEASCYKGPWP